jgi:hypothetical protein
MTPRRRKQSYEYSTAELEALTADLDAEFVADKFGPLSPADRRLWTKAKRKRGRPRVGAGAKVVSVSIEKGLLTRADRLAKRLHLSRARLIAFGLEQVLGRTAKPSPRQRSTTTRAKRRAA